MNTNHIQGQINGKAVSYPQELKDFDLHQKPSSNIVYFGVNKSSGQLFIQFTSGSYILSDVPEAEQENFTQADSVGRYYHAFLKGRYETHKVELKVEEITA